MGRVAKEKLQLLPKNELTNASAASPKKRAVPNVDDLLSLTPRSKQSKQKFDTNLEILALHFCDDASAYGPEFGEGRLFSLQMATCAKPDPLFMFLAIFRKLIEFKSASDADFPGSLPLFQTAFQCKLVYTGRDQKVKTSIAEDIDGAGYVLHRTGFYVNEDAMKNLIMILDEFMQFRMTYVDELVSCMKALPDLRIYHPFGASLAICKKENEMACDVQLFDSATYRKMSIFDMHPPCFPRRPVTCTVELQSPSVYHMNYGGSTKLFAEAFNTAGALYCTHLASPSDTYPEIFRVLKDIPFEDALAKFKSIHSDVLSSNPILVRTNRHGFDAVNVIKFLEELNLLANVKIITD